MDGMSYIGLHRGVGKSHFQQELYKRLVQERQSLPSELLVWLSEIAYSSFFWDGKFRKKFSKEVLDAPEVPKVEWAHY